MILPGRVLPVQTQKPRRAGISGNDGNGDNNDGNEIPDRVNPADSRDLLLEISTSSQESHNFANFT